MIIRPRDLGGLWPVSPSSLINYWHSHFITSIRCIPQPIIQRLKSILTWIDWIWLAFPAGFPLLLWCSPCTRRWWWSRPPRPCSRRPASGTGARALPPPHTRGWRCRWRSRRTGPRPGHPATRATLRSRKMCEKQTFVLLILNKISDCLYNWQEERNS